MIGIIESVSSKPDLRARQYKHIRDVMASQGYIAAGAAAGSCVLLNYGSENFKRLAADVLLCVTPFVAATVTGKAITVGRKVGHLYRVGTTLYNGGMYPFKCINFFSQSPLFGLDMIMVGEVYVPNMDAKWWNLKNAAADTEDLVEWLDPKK